VGVDRGFIVREGFMKAQKQRLNPFADRQRLVMVSEYLPPACLFLVCRRFVRSCVPDEAKEAGNELK